MNRSSPSPKSLRDLEARLDYLEEVNRFALEVLEMAASMADFQTSINKLHEPSRILRETRSRAERLLPFQCTAFFLVDEGSSDFHLFDCKPGQMGEWVQDEMNFLIEDGTFARALRANRPVTVFARDFEKQLLLHVMATSSRVRGMFVGVPQKPTTYMADVSLSLLSIVMLSSANTLESFELYRKIREFNAELEDKVRKLTASEQELTLHRSMLEDVVQERTAQLEASISRLSEEVSERCRAEQQLKNSQELLKNIFYSIPDLLTVRDTDLRVVMTNLLQDRTGAASLGASEAMRLFHDSCGADSTPCNPCPVREAFESGEIRQADLNLPDGTVKEIRAFPMLSDNGKVGMVGEYIRDISQKKKMEEALLRAQKLESIGVLAGGIAHDFNNFLTAILGNISLASMELESREKVLERLKDAETACLRARSLTLQLLTFSKRGAPIKRLVSIGELLKDTARFSLRGTGVMCEISLEDGLWWVEADEGQLEQVISNLFINARQAMPQGGCVRVTAENVTVTSQHGLQLPDGPYVKVEIADNGSGIAEEHLPKVFDPYFTTKPEGNGLGLTTSYSILKRHGGCIDVESRMGVGSTFMFYLPAVWRIGRGGGAEGRCGVFGKGRVLLMDDEEMVRKTAAGMLRGMGYEVELAEDGRMAVELYREAMEADSPFDAVVLDLTVQGGIGGLETLERLLAIDPEVKAVLSSGYSRDPVVADCERYGFRGVISKPYKVQELGGVLGRVVRSEE